MKKITLLIIFLITMTSCKSHLKPSKTNTDIEDIQLSDIKKAALDSLVYKVANTNSCSMIAAIKGPNTATYYSGFNGKTKEQINTFNALYEVGRSTNMFTAASIFKLIEQKKLKVDDYLTAILPQKALYSDLLVINGINYIDSVKVSQLLNHSSGLPDYLSENSEKEITIYNNSTALFTANDLINLAKENPNKKVFIPGTKFSYCHLNYIFLGLIIEKLSKQTYQDYVQKHILNPLKLKHTYFGSLYPLEKRPKGHYKGEISLMPFTIAGSAGEILSTLDDMQTFITAWYKGLLFKDPNTLHNLKNNGFITMVPGVITYGYGLINIMDLSLGYGGQASGFQSYAGTSINNNYTFAFYIDDASVSVWYPAIETSRLLNEIK